ncbi:translocation/assembly module TamB domain-containing protein [Congregibacter variabilis]|uniref:Translocation/assembly module TamB domain-containing protein n=1 Tax=Congregibacter variabilis TaxID=3081200 RepID=A0ABZ0I664_9GAMM|nr:translocation/assembly module TamB domain-containing protein [Congregibacter sp. IMCC43200]
MRRRVVAYLALAVLLLIPLLPVFVLGTDVGLGLGIRVLEARLPIQVENPQGSFWTGMSLDVFRYDDESLSMELQDLHLRVAWACVLRSTLCVRDASASKVSLAVKAASKPTDQPLQAPLPWLPVAVNIDRLAVDELVFYRGSETEVLKNLRLSGDVASDTALIEAFSGEHRLARWSGGGAIARSGRWDLKLDVAVQALAVSNWPENLDHSFTLDFSGDLRALKGDISASAGSPALALAVDLSSAGLITASGSLEGLSDLVPQSNALSNVSGVGPFLFESKIRDAKNLKLALRQQWQGFAPEPVWLELKLAQQAAVWELEQAVLGEASQPLLRASGFLGELESLAPRLEVVADQFHVPLKDGSPEMTVTGVGDIAFSALDPLGTLSLALRDIDLQEGSNQWEMAGDLSASDVPVLPLGSLKGARNGLAFSYHRTSQPGAAALLELPQGLPPSDVSISALSARVFPGEVTQLEIKSEGDLRGNLEVALQKTDQGATFLMQPFVVFFRDEAVRGNEPVAGRWDATEASILLDALCLQWRANSMCAQSAVLGQSGSLGLTLEIDEELQGAVSDKPFSIQAQGTGTLDLLWTAGVLEDALFDLSFDLLSLDPFMYEGTALPIRWEQARASGYFRPDAKNLSLDLRSERVGVLAATLTEQGAELTGSLKASDIDLASLDDLLPEWSLGSGAIEADMTVAGSRSQPLLFGQLALKGAGAEHPEIATTLTDANLLLDATGDGFTIDGSAMLGGAPLTLTGLCCDDGALQAELQGVRNQLSLPVGVEATISPRLDLQLTTQSLAVSGDISVHKGEFQHAGPLENAIAVSDDFYRVDLPAKPPRRFDLSLDLRALIEPGFTLRSRELVATLSGDLRVNMQPELPASLYGDLQVLGGELRAYGQVLRLTQGSVGFVGDPFNPALNLSAERRIRAEDLRVGFYVRGSLEEPVFEIFSDPVRSERDTLSYLLRGRGPDAGASVDGTAMALSLGASAINQSGALESLNAIPGLSGVSLGAEGSDDDMAATISAYVGERLYLSYGVGIYEPVNALTARLYLRSRLWLEVVSRLESSFDLYYRFDIE